MNFLIKSTLYSGLLLCLQLNAAAETFYVSTTEAFGPGSLGQAISDSNANAGPWSNTISFAGFPTDGIITPSVSLPVITQTVLIDGYTQPDSACNTNALFVGDPDPTNNAVITVQLQGPGAFYDTTGLQPLVGLQLDCDGATIQGLAITDWAVVQLAVLGEFDPVVLVGNGIQINGSNNSILGNFIGVAPDGVTDERNFFGIVIAGANNQIGDGTICGRNLLSGMFGAGYPVPTYSNHGNGVILDIGYGTSIMGNTIGLTRAGNAAVASDSRVGIAEFGVDCSIIGNVIAGQSAANILIDAATNITVQGNNIGTDVSGSIAVGPNGVGIWAGAPVYNGVPSGIVIDSNLISGGTYGLMIGENAFGDLPIMGAAITNNLIGTDTTGFYAIPNLLDGLWVKLAQATCIGGNTIAGNGRHGIRLDKSQLALIKGNYIGTNANGDDLGNGAGSAYVPGGQAGVLPGGCGIFVGGLGTGIHAFGDIIGGARISTVPYPIGEGNYIQYNAGYGIKTQGFVEATQIEGNLITNNGLGGISINKGASGINAGGFRSAGSNRLMGDLTSQGDYLPQGGPLGTSNTIENNGGNGITIYQADGNELQANIIEGNNGAGIQIIGGSHNLIGSLDPANTATFSPYLNFPNPLGNQILNNIGGAGVEVIQQDGEAVANAILTNAIYGNTQNGNPANGISLIRD